MRMILSMLLALFVVSVIVYFTFSFVGLAYTMDFAIINPANWLPPFRASAALSVIILWFVAMTGLIDD